MAHAPNRNGTVSPRDIEAGYLQVVIEEDDGSKQTGDGQPDVGDGAVDRTKSYMTSLAMAKGNANGGPAEDDGNHGGDEASPAVIETSFGKKAKKGRTSSVALAAARAAAAVKAAKETGAELPYALEDSDDDEEQALMKSKSRHPARRAATIGHGPRAYSASAPGSSSDLASSPHSPHMSDGKRLSGSASDLRSNQVTRSLSLQVGASRPPRSMTCTSQSFHNENADLIPELREHRSAALHESRTAIGRCMSSHTKALLTLPRMSVVDGAEVDDSGAPKLLRWRSLEDLDLKADKRPESTPGVEPYDVHTNKRRGTMAAEAAFHPGGAQSDHEASSSESEEGKSSDEEEDVILERMLEKDLKDHGITLSPSQDAHQAARLHDKHHRERHHTASVDVDHIKPDSRDNDDDVGGLRGGLRARQQVDDSLRIPGLDDEREAKTKTKNIHLTLSSMRRSISELVLIADSLDVRVLSSAQHLRKCSYNLLEAMVAVKEHIYENIHLLKYNQATAAAEPVRARGMLNALRMQHGGRSRVHQMQPPGSPRRRGHSLSSEGSDTISLSESIASLKDKQTRFPTSRAYLRRYGGITLLTVLGFVIMIVLFLSAARQPHGAHDPLAHVYFAAYDHNGSIPVDANKPLTWVELHVSMPAAESNHYGEDRETVIFDLQSRPRGTSVPFASTGDGTNRCKQSESGVRACYFEGFTDLDSNNDYRFAYHLDDPSDHASIPFEAHAIQMGFIGKAKLWFCAIILIGALVTIAKEWIHRTLVAMLGAMLVLGLLLWCDLFPDLQTVVEWIDEGTLALLFGMMIIVGRLAETGFFQVATARVLPFANQSTYRLVVILCVLTGVLSAFLDNVTTMILLAPITIELAQALQIDPIPLLIAETLFSNVGGAATLIGDPPNIIVGSAFPEITFVDFLANMLPGVVIMYGPLLLFLRWQYKKELTGPLEHFYDGLEVAQGYKITNWPLLKRSLIVLGFVLIAFITHSVHHVNPAWAAMIGAIALMLASDPHEIDHALESVEWDVLLFFAALFIMVEGVAELGFIRFIGGVFQDAIEPAPEEHRLSVAIALLIWISSIVSAFLDNIPYTATMIPVIAQLADDDDGLGLDLKTLAWALCFGACLGGNGSLIGASANIVVSSIAHRSGHELSFSVFFRTSFPFMLVSVVFAHAYMLLRYTL
mmetsp:Transcript_6615/g.17022  ORF Transcript_6615/g.17022 Transcript_6615/m.17022 type:complete len:1176 (+) Transcript_6615:142-3669(+)|eukprot:CAMPEP_0182940916 /NCGR_PEP_ID=MMETSP0105_2-20130417/48093_1 /TAXON_ID=81532 ORGANISM="Acanthoeca-like sp., Strain 10tr" /NCGR_SAMPLE_ID=MMETSP0105_2 /ASSEMBLY_ACC=CAM_ASM_000205 /LENGTH=1175 /DNA_ID=CAMNT_0025080467 /DNA_START=132 /DNA_END=3659 /DNA_ORIENTATION=+